MIKGLLLSVFLFSFWNVNAQTTAIPDVNFEQQLISLGIDTNGANGNILNSDAQAVTTLTLSGNTITNLTGLEAFVNVVTLNLGTNQFATVPLTTLTLLQELVFDQNVVLANLNLSNNVNLKKLDIRANGGTNAAPITVIDLSNNLQLEYIHIYNFKLLQNVIYPNTNTVKYVYLLMFANINVNFSGYSSLETLTLSVNFSNILTISVVLPNNQTILKSASFQGGNIVNANFSNALGLTYLSMQQTNTQTLQLPITNTLKTIRISGHKIDNVNFANASDLEDLSITSKGVAIPLNIDISQNLLLKQLDASSNYMTTINVIQNVLLEKIDVSSNQLPLLNVNQNVLLKDLNASYNLLPTVILTQNVLLRNLQLRNNVIPNLNLTANVVLERADISNNLFTTTGLDLTQNILLNYFKASFNQIESLNISQNAVLINLILDHNLFFGTAILDQFYSLRLNNDGIYGGTLNVSFNKLSGVIPNYTSLFHLGSPTINSWTRYFTFYFDNNNFEFGHFENQHPSYLIALTTFSPMPIVLPVMTAYYYAPQAKVNLVETPIIAAGTPITLTTTVSGAQNHYKWFKNNVAIVGAPDSPNYVIASANPCDNGVYHCEITSDLVPFENANPPGTNGKNLLLIRNNITLTVTPVANVCSTLVFPAPLSTNATINPTITWTDSPNACSYSISIGTTSGGTQILNNVNVGDVNFYTLASNLPVNSQIFVTITPNYQSGPAPICTEQSFTTGTLVAVVPTCVTAMDYPAINAINIAVTQNFSWIPVANATGYTVIMGTTPGGSQIAGTTNLVTNVFNPTADLPQGVPVYLTITPYNSDGNAIGCSVFQFTVETIPNPPTCPTSYSIANNATNVSINTAGISWPSVSSQTQYYVTIGTTPTGTQYENNYFNNTSEYYAVPTPFAYSTTYYLTIIVRDQSTGTYGSICSTIVFTTEAAPLSLPNCATNISPSSGSLNVLVDANITWNAVANATGYYISIGTTSGGTNIVNNFNTGNLLSYNPASDFAQNTIYYLTITPYNATGNAVSCSEIQFTTQTIPVVPTCATNISPSSGSLNVLVDSNITWNAVANATGYYISIGTTSGGTQIVNNFDNGNVTTYNPALNFNQNTVYYITITPYNSTGNAVGCTSQSFTTEIIIVIPPCTTLTFPINNATNVVLNSDITWNSSATATGYFLAIGTTFGGTDVVNTLDNGNSTTFNPTFDFDQNTTYFVTITPYNSAGNAAGCTSQSFTTETIVVIPTCTTLFSPLSGSANVNLNSDITWNAISNATGYFISIGTTSGSTDFVNNVNVGNVTTYNPVLNFNQNTVYFITITPYNSAGNAAGCTSQSFTTETIVLKIPLYFSPNGDGFNDLWTIEDTYNEVKSISVFDRYGKLLKQFIYNEGWNGTFNNKELPATDYWYVIEKKDKQILKGHFSLIR